MRPAETGRLVPPLPCRDGTGLGYTQVSIIWRCVFFAKYADDVIQPMIVGGWRSGFGSALRIRSRTIHGMFPWPNRRKLRFASIGLSLDQPKWISGGLPTFDNSRAMAAIT